MKRLGTFLFLVLTLSSCWDDINCTTAKGSIETKTVALDNIKGINLNVNANVYVSEGSVQTVTVEGKEDALLKLKTDVRNGIWIIDFDQCVLNHDLTVHITIPKLTYVKISGSGDVYGETPFASGDELVEFRISGSGYMNLEMNAENIETTISGSGDIRLSGEANNHKLQISGSGSLTSYELKSVNHDVNISGSGNAEVFVDGGVLDAKISGSGKVYYKGNPSSFIANISGSGKIIDSN